MKQGFKNDGFLHDATVPWLNRHWASVVRREVAQEAASEASEASGASGLAVHWEIMDLCMTLPSGYVKIAIEKWPLIVDFPIKNGDFL